MAAEEKLDGICNVPVVILWYVSIWSVASKGGAPHHPAWYHNLKSDPRVVVQTRAGVEDRIAHEAEGEERDKLFETMAATYTNFAAYQARATKRKIPVVVLSRITDERSSRGSGLSR